MKRYNIICAVVLSSLSLQQVVAEQLDKQVTVTRAYIPTVESATKLTLTPDTSDNTYIKPDIDYSITPLSIGTTLQTELYSPTQMSFSEYDRPERFYLKAGGGYPFNTVFDIYASSLKSSKGYIMGFANQEGRFADIKNDYGVESDATQNHIKAGVAGGLYLGNQTLEGSLNFDYDKWSRYATASIYDTHPTYQDVDFSLRYGDNFLDLQRLNFAIEADVNYFWSVSDFDNTTIGANGILGYRALGGDMTFALGYNTISGVDGYHDNTFRAAIHYALKRDNLTFAVGLEFYNDNISLGDDDDNYDFEDIYSSMGNVYGYTSESDSNYLIPNVDLSYKLNSDKAIAYFNLAGDIKHNDFGTLSRENPYLSPGLAMPESSVEHDAALGIKGRVADDTFGYNFYVGYNRVVNNIYWAYCEYGVVDTNLDLFVNNLYGASISNQYNFNVNLDLEYHPTTNLLLQLGLSYRDFNNDKDQLIADGEANTTVRFDGRYSVGKIQFGLSAELLSSREFSQLNYTTYNYSLIEIPTTFDMGLSVDYNVNSKFVIFAHANNILNNDLYNWARYREYGANFAMGVKVEF